MARRGVKKQEHEKLDDATISHVIGLLNSDKPITKKEACNILNISYNTSRLSKLIGEYNDRVKYEEDRRKRNRGKPFSDYEVKDVILSYLKGQSVAEIARGLFRTTDGVKKILNEYNIPERSRHSDYAHPELLPDEALSENYEPGEYAWSARYNCVVEIISITQVHKFHGNVYKIYIFGKYNQFGAQPWYELGKLDFLKTIKIKGLEFSTTENHGIQSRITD